MAYFAYSAVNSPSAAGYDEDYPTRNQELLADELLRLLNDCSDASFRFFDGINTEVQNPQWAEWIHDTTEIVRKYAEEAIADYRAQDPIGIAEPTWETIPWILWTVPPMQDSFMKHWVRCNTALHVIYYMWKSEVDPLRIRDYLIDTLLTVPLNDVTVDLKEDSGAQIKVYPTFQTVDV